LDLGRWRPQSQVRIPKGMHGAPPHIICEPVK